MLENRGYITAEALKNAMQGVGTKQNRTVVREFSDFLDEKSKCVGISISSSTLTRYQAAYKYFKRFLNEKYVLDDIPFSKLDLEMIETYVLFQKIDLRLSSSTIKVNMKPLRTLALRVFHRGTLRQDPFFDYKYEKILKKPKWISNDELERMMQVEMKLASCNFTKEMFVFACYTGISYADLYHLKHSDIHDLDDGSRMITFKRKKTNATSCIPILPAAQAILDKHRETKFAGRDGKVFKMQTLANMEGHLKKIAKAAKVDKCLTFHMGRHTFATTVCLSQGVPIETVSRMLGHTSIKTTQIYAEITRTKLNEDMTHLEKRIDGKYKLA